MNNNSEFVGKSILKTLLESNGLFRFIFNIDDEFKLDIINQRLVLLESKISDYKDFQKKYNELARYEDKYIQFRKFLNYYLFKSDPQLIETNIYIILDYIDNKYKHSIYDILLEKTCLLNRHAISLIRDIKSNIVIQDNYIKWEELIEVYKKYNEFDINISYSEMLANSNPNEINTEIVIGLKTLIDAGFISQAMTSYPGSVSNSDITAIQLTNLGKILMNYL